MFIGVAISALWLIYPIAIIWLRFPFSVQPSFGRYLIMPAVSLSIFLGIISKRKKSENTNILFLVFIFIFLNFFSSNKYLSDLHRARNLTISEKIRKSLPKIKELEKESIEGHPLTFYFEGKEKEILYHTVLFGFPTIVAIQEI